MFWTLFSMLFIVLLLVLIFFSCALYLIIKSHNSIIDEINEEVDR